MIDVALLAIEFQIPLKVREALSLLVFAAVAIEAGVVAHGDECEALLKLSDAVNAAGFPPPDKIIATIEQYRSERASVARERHTPSITLSADKDLA